MSYIQDFQSRILNSVSDEEDKALLLVLTHKDRLENIEKKFGKDVEKKLEKLSKSGLLVEILKDNPSDIQRYYQTTELGQAVLRYLAQKDFETNAAK